MSEALVAFGMDLTIETSGGVVIDEVIGGVDSVKIGGLMEWRSKEVKFQHKCLCAVEGWMRSEW